MSKGPDSDFLDTDPGSGSTLVLGRSDRTLRLDGPNEACLIVSSLIAQAHNTILLSATSLEREIFDLTRVSEALAAFVTKNPRCQAHFVLAEPDSLLRENPRILALFRRFTSFLQARRTGEEHLGLAEMFVVVDDTGYLHQPHFDKKFYLANFAAPPTAGRFVHRFTEIWERSEPIHELHTLGL